ncbi:alpha/beta hydrolase [Streptomyces albidoflavus]|uniref:alpha/beta fold hydrolase n=3 Tax=Streptomyces TaxID=1883 RepID=UPI0020BE238B|nr:alpha/beta hydrolase [Streptomyces albidoflavus]MCL6281802.1 alpha/beta hydrolase [Streptomyces albidoflavus]MCX4464488.1 alpha/beta hydrolase [Streptomyces albidoflavus]WSI94062.1 alpha/beta hydrolase [Streptomyces albidoflavus]
MGGVVLVHGLYHQAGHFGVVAAGLRRVGVEVVVPELHRGSLREDTRVVQEAVDGFGVAPVVVGHSYGGSVITGVRGAGHLVYLAAFVLDAGVLYDDCPAPLARRAVGLLREQGPGCGRGVPERQGWRTTPSTYVVCARDRAIDPGVQRRMAARCGEVREWPTGHSPFVGRPELVVGLVREVLAGIGGRG